MNPLFPSPILDSSTYQEGKKLILESIERTCSQITDIATASSNYVVNYNQALSDMSELRGTNLYYPLLGSGLGNGALVQLADGSIKYDFICGIGTHFFGHCHLGLISSVIDGAISDTVMQGNLHQNQDSYELLQLLKQKSGLDHLLISTSGAMANENALKIVFQKRVPAHRLLAFDGCFMGRTLALAAITDKPAYREGLPQSVQVDYLPFYDPSDHKASIEKTKSRLLYHIKRYPNQHAAICIEPIQGENGFYVGNSEFFKEICTVCKENNILIFVDEVQTFARTSSLFAFHYFNMQEYVDVVTLGKVFQAAATLWKDSVNPKIGLLSQTFTASTASIHAAQFTIKYTDSKGLFGPSGRVVQIEKMVHERLKKIEEKYPGMCQGPYGIGSMVAFTTLQGDSKKVASFLQKLFSNGVIAFTAGTKPVRVRFLLPAPVIKDEDIDKALSIVEKTIHECANL